MAATEAVTLSQFNTLVTLQLHRNTHKLWKMNPSASAFLNSIHLICCRGFSRVARVSAGAHPSLSWGEDGVTSRTSSRFITAPQRDKQPFALAHVFGLWEEAGEPGENPHGENVHSPHSRGLKPPTSLLWGDGDNHSTTSAFSPRIFHFPFFFPLVTANVLKWGHLFQVFMPCSPFVGNCDSGHHCLFVTTFTLWDLTTK